MTIQSPVAQDMPDPKVPLSAVHDDIDTAIETPDQTVLITEAEVLFATAAASGVSKKQRSWTDLFSRVFAAAHRQSRPSQHHVPRRLYYLEGARMAREMERL